MGCHRQIYVFLGVAAWLFLANAPAAVQADGEETPAGRVQQLIEQLGAPSFVAREAATRQLTEIGPAAKDALLAVLASPDAEMRTRARRILEIVLERDFQRRLRAFAADDSPDRDYGLPCWGRFRDAFDNEPATRRLFVEMQKGEPALLDVAEATPQLAAETLEARMRQMQEDVWDEDDDTEEEPSAGRAAAIMFVAADAKVVLSEETASYVAELVYQQPFQEALGNGATSATMRKLLGAWVRKSLTAGIGLRAQNMMLAQQFDLPETLDLALSLVSDETMEPYLRPYAVMAVAKFGKKEHLAVLSKLLEDDSPCGEFGDDEEEAGDTIVCQVRDAALAAMICLTGQSLSDYGFEGIDNSEALEMELSELGFKNQARRDRAFARWKKWSADNPQP